MKRAAKRPTLAPMGDTVRRWSESEQAWVFVRWPYRTFWIAWGVFAAALAVCCLFLS